MKRIIGRKYSDIYIHELMKSNNIRFKIVPGEGDNAEIQLKHDGLVVTKTPVQVCSEILKYLRESANEYLGTEITEAVISIPAHFSNAQRKATKAAAEMAGFTVLKLITEPVAAAIHYTSDRDTSSTLLVFDFGGGTLDVSVVDVDSKIFEVRGIEGDTFLGGRYLDNILTDHFQLDIKNTLGITTINDRDMRRLSKACNKLKTKLSMKQFYSIPMYGIADSRGSYDLEISRDSFQKMATDLFQRAVGLVELCLTNTGVLKKDINEVVLVGGSTRIPKIRDMLKLYFNEQELKTDLNPDEAVALGSAVQAAILKEKLQELEKYRITEVTPLSIGESLEGLMSVAIKKNTPLPASGTIDSVSTRNDQNTVLTDIFKGERKNCQFNNLLGSFVVNNLPPGKAGDVKFETTFHLDEDGILEVTSQETMTGNSNKLVVTLSELRLCESQKKQTLRDAEVHKENDEQFEDFMWYKWEVRRRANRIIYNLNKIPSEGDRSFVEEQCNNFLQICKTIKYTQKDELQRENILFMNSIKEIVRNLGE
ncbi:uncharacterized protein LOC132703273 [Cylas formicarius]|uniref:uncharacterized protein LOC132703273 n=1 Tax=Cylas formicarius TaxID=197179 RepID=UPI0029587508|nr:uncharacterized protein LOC132703273 [Cylas formicarius]